MCVRLSKYSRIDRGGVCLLGVSVQLCCQAALFMLHGARRFAQ